MSCLRHFNSTSIRWLKPTVINTKARLKQIAINENGLQSHQPPFHLVLQILCNEFLNPVETLHATSLQILPALGMEGEHHPAGEIACFKGGDDVGGGVVATAQEVGIGYGAGGHGFVAYAHFVPVPPAAGVGEV